MLRSVLLLSAILAGATALRLGNISNPDLATEAVRFRDDLAEASDYEGESENLGEDFETSNRESEGGEEAVADIGDRDANNCMDNVTLHFPEGTRWRRHCREFPCAPETIEQLRWVRVKPKRLKKDVDLPQPPPKLAVLVVAMYGFTNPRVWSNWIKNATRSGLDFAFHIHMKNSSIPFENSDFQKYVLTHSRKTRWCKIGDAEWALMEKGLEDPNVTHMAVVSADSIPLKPLSYMYDDLRKASETRLCFEWTSDERAETWWVMRRDDVQLLTQHESLINIAYRSRCEEERMWMRPLMMRSFHWGPKYAPLRDACLMYNHWGQTVCNGWRSHELMGTFTSLDTESDWRNGASGHPRTYYNLSRDGAKNLEVSVFWWARKFAKGAIPKNLLRFRPS